MIILLQLKSLPACLEVVLSFYLKQIGNRLAVVGRIKGQAYCEVKVLDKFHQALHELGAPTVALRTVVQIDEQGRDVGKALFDALPPVDPPTHRPTDPQASFANSFHSALKYGRVEV